MIFISESLLSYIQLLSLGEILHSSNCGVPGVYIVGTIKQTQKSRRFLHDLRRLLVYPRDP